VHARREVAKRKEEGTGHRRLRCGQRGRGRRDDGYGPRQTRAQGGCLREAELRGHNSGKKGQRRELACARARWEKEKMTAGWG